MSHSSSACGAWPTVLCFRRWVSRSSWEWVIGSNGPQVLVNHAHRRRALAHRRGHPLAGAEAGVAGAEDARYGRLDREGIARGRPAGGTVAVVHEVPPREHEPVGIALDHVGHQSGAWWRSPWTTARPGGIGRAHV